MSDKPILVGTRWEKVTAWLSIEEKVQINSLRVVVVVVALFFSSCVYNIYIYCGLIQFKFGWLFKD